MLELRYYQSECVFSIFDYFRSGKTGNPVCALPTGTGKSLCIADFIKTTMLNWPNQKIMMLTHVKELIEQNGKALLKQWNEAPLGIHSAGLDDRNTHLPIIFGGIQSVSKTIKKAEINPFGHRDIIIIDEAHLLSPKEDTMYQYTINELLKVNPNLKVVGFTATPYRLKQGMIVDEGLFTDVCYDITGVDAFNRLIVEGFISPLIPKKTGIEIDISNLSLQAGDFNGKELLEASDKDEITYAAVKEMIEYGYNRKKWLVFTAGIKHSEHVAAMLQSFGINAVAIHSKLSKETNDEIIRAYKNDEIHALVNNNKLTTGFDCPQIDMIGMLRATMSPGLWVQMLGRGTRPADGKDNCLVLDFAGNTKRLGPINDPVKPKKPGKGGPGDAPIRICPECGVYNHASARWCINCGAEFKFESKLFKKASLAELIKSDNAPIVEYFNVHKVIYNLHIKEGSPPSIKVSYFCGLQMFNKWVCLEHNGLTGKHARDWWRQHHYEEPPITTYEALKRVNELRVPNNIRVHINKKYPEVLGYEY